MIYIIGSGPAGIATAFGLIAKGEQVTMLDAGIEIEGDRRKRVEDLKRMSKDQWLADDLDFLRENTNSDLSGIRLKHVYGSSFPYQGVENHIPIETKNVDCLPSLAKGGFSNVWGANLLPYRNEDMVDWPISAEDLAPHYRAILKFINFSAVTDDLASIFPLYADQPEPLQLSQQARSFINCLNQNREVLNQRGFTFGQSRLAVRSIEKDGQTGCVYCGMCMYGCPYELIFNSASCLQRLSKVANFKYKSGILVEKLIETNESVTIQAKSLHGNVPFEFKASRVFLGCGPLTSTRILLESLDAHDVELSLKDSQYFLLPCLKLGSAKEIEKQELHTLSQVYVELSDSKISKYLIHLQFYMYNDLYKQALTENFLGLFKHFGVLRNEILSRIMVIQGYLHSDTSSSIAIRLSKKNKEKNNKIMLTSKVNGGAAKAVHRVGYKLIKNWKRFGMVPLFPFLNIAKPGRGYHVGGSFPMTHNPKRFETDIYGKPYGFKRVHVVDSTVFPSLPATTMTMTVMANAHRIANTYE